MRVSPEYHARVLDVIEVCKRHVIEGTGSMQELTQVLNRTNDLIRGNFSPDAYQEYANGISRHSTNMKVLTGVMLALAAFALGALAVITVVSGGIGVLPATILASSSFGFFAGANAAYKNISNPDVIRSVMQLSAVRE